MKYQLETPFLIPQHICVYVCVTHKHCICMCYTLALKAKVYVEFILMRKCVFEGIELQDNISFIFILFKRPLVHLWKKTTAIPAV